METSRDLLFGVMALRTGLIDADQFASACRRWSAQRQTPLADVLLERDWLRAADREHVDYLVERAVTSHGGREDAALKTLADVTVWRSLASLTDPDLRRWLAEILPGASWLEHEERPKRGLVGVGVLILVLLGIAGIGGVVLLLGSVFWIRAARVEQMEAMRYAEEAQAQAQAARDVEMQARLEAEKNQQMARAAVDQTLTQAAEQGMAKRDEFNKAILQRGLEFTEKAHKEAVQAGNERKVAQLTRRLAQVRESLGQKDQARQTYEQALPLLEKQVAATPKDAEMRHELAATALSLSRLLRKAQKYKEAEPLIQRAIEHFAKLAADFPAAAESRGDLAAAYEEWSQQLEDSGRPAEAEQTLRQAIELLRTLAVAAPDQPEYPERLKAAMKKLETLRPQTKKEGT
jgi:tetratricopeptide (TPR) repeat protein